MKTIEEKAKAYDEAVEGIQEILSSGQEFINMSRLKLRLQPFFSELKESEDDRIRKEITNIIMQSTCNTEKEFYRKRELIDWLEKQGKEKPIYNLEQLSDLADEYYSEVLIGECGMEETQAHQCRLAYFNGLKKANEIQNTHAKFVEQCKQKSKFKVGDYIERKDGLGCHAKIIFIGKNVYGCEKLIYPEDSSPFFELMFENQDEFRVSSDFQQKSAWSEEDEKMFAYALDMIEWYGGKNEDKTRVVSDWIKSLKGRVQPVQEWSEEDESIVENILYWLKSTLNKSCYPRYEYWVESLKARVQSKPAWKPSEEQMKVLDEVLNYAANHESPYCNDYIFGTLNNLIRQLKKLKGK